jgi:hypothetical protein
MEILFEAGSVAADFSVAVHLIKIAHTISGIIGGKACLTQHTSIFNGKDSVRR